MPLLALQHVSFEVGTAMLLDDFNLTVQASEVHALSVTNGTGKSTLACLHLDQDSG
jgi:Fe-S cluster assembly ATPase SufC